MGLAAKFTLPARAILPLFFVGASGWALASLARRSSFRIILPALTLTVTQFLWFLLPAVIELVSGREIPQTRYSSGLLAVLHSTQYLWITSYYQKKEARAAGDSHWSFSRYLLTLISGGIGLFIPAVDVDSAQSNAQLYLAQALDQQGELQAAARHYRVYLKIIAARHQKNPADTGPVLAALIKVADADAAINHTADATKGYSAAAGFADKSGEKALESLALVHMADLQEKQADIAGAAQSYQHALQLDATLTDSRSSASDWFNYAQFLRKQQQPERFVFSCLLPAENALQNAPGDELTVISQARKESEARLGQVSLAVRRKLDETVTESLGLRVATPPATK